MITKNFIKIFVHPWWATYPDFFQIFAVFLQLLIDELLVPPVCSFTAKPHIELKVVTTSLLDQLLQAFAKFQTKGLLATGEGEEERKLEVFAVYLRVFFGLQKTEVFLD
jgi:hypothetical protein